MTPSNDLCPKRLEASHFPSDELTHARDSPLCFVFDVLYRVVNIDEGDLDKIRHDYSPLPFLKGSLSYFRNTSINCRFQI